MRRFFFLPSEVFFGLLFVWIYTIFALSFGYILLVSIICGVVFFASRRASIPFRDTLKDDGEIFLSPIHGEVKSIRRNVELIDYPEFCHEIRIAISGWTEKGLYLPTSGEVVYLKAVKGRRIAREAEDHEFYGPVDDVAHTDFVLSTNKKNKALLRFIDGKYAKRPTIWLKSGDRGRGAACFGYYPFGGTLLIYLPENTDILVFENEKVVPGQSVIAVLNDQTRTKYVV